MHDRLELPVPISSSTHADNNVGTSSGVNHRYMRRMRELTGNIRGAVDRCLVLALLADALQDLEVLDQLRAEHLRTGSSNAMAKQQCAACLGLLHDDES